MLLDKATSALDAKSEILVQDGLNAAMQGRTTLIIAHRLATVKKVNRTIVLNQGRIVEIGTPEDLRKQSGLYAKLAVRRSIIQSSIMENDKKVRMTTLDSVCNTRHRQLSDHEITVTDRPKPASRCFR